jgi:hypothetical protein
VGTETGTARDGGGGGEASGAAEETYAEECATTEDGDMAGLGAAVTGLDAAAELRVVVGLGGAATELWATAGLGGGATGLGAGGVDVDGAGRGGQYIGFFPR